MNRFVAFLVTAVFLAGCNANLGLQIGSTGKSATQPTVGPGGSFSSGGIGVRFGDVPGVGSFLGAVGLGRLMGRNRGMEGSRPAPAMDENRKVNEQDCGQVLQESAANLRCR